jgi:hypothetical protein
MKVAFAYGAMLATTVVGCSGGTAVGDAGGITDVGASPETGRNVAAECEGIVGAPMAGHVSWRINGQVKCGSTLYAGYVYEAPRAAFTLELDTPDGNDSLFLAVRSWTSMVLAGTHRCQAADADIGMAEVVFDVRSDALATLPATIDDCTVTLDPPGTVGDATASGTFSAMGHTDTGISLSVSAGIFATPTEY